MSWNKIAAAGAIAGTLGLAAMGLGAGAASADPGGGHGGPPCWAPYCHDQGNGRDDHPQRFDYDDHWDQRGIDNARFDHRPFNYQGVRVEPYFDNVRAVWGFWFFGVFIAL
jgi:hypothetical protein